MSGDRSPARARPLPGTICCAGRVEVFLGALIGLAGAASVWAAARLLRPPRVISSEVRAMQEALHAATVTPPHLRVGRSAESAAKTVAPLRTLSRAAAVAPPAPPGPRWRSRAEGATA